MNINIINEGAQIIAPAYFHSAIRNAFLSEKQAVGNIRISTLDTFLSEGMEEDKSFYEYYRKLKEKRKSLHYNQNSATSYSYIQEVMRFIEDVKEFDVSLDLLPVKNPFQKEIKDIISHLYPIKTKTDIQKKKIFRKLENYQFENTFIMDNSASLYEESIYRLFCVKGAKRVQEDSIVQEKKWFHALNARQEVESVAQYIIENELQAENIKISILQPSYLKEIHRIFHRYKIPYYSLQEKETSDLLQRFTSLLEYYLNPNTENLKQLFLKHVFSHKYERDFIQYITLHHLTLDKEFNITNNIQIREDVLDKKEIEKLQRLEEHANNVRASILPFLHTLLSIESKSELLLYIEKFICESFPFKRMEERRILLTIREEIKKGEPYIHDKEDLEFFISLLKDKKVAMENVQKGIVITNFNQPLAYYPYHFVLGCTQENYPAFVAKKGIFDENYYQELNFPTLQSRYQFHLKKWEHCLNSSKVLICFAPLSTIDGKACETSLEIENFIKIKAVRYPLKNRYQSYQRQYKIKEDLAQQLFLKEDGLHGSISSFERYMSCPYSYYLRYGLRLEEPIDYTFNNAKSGILSHLIMETLVNRYGKEYTNTKKTEVAGILEKHFEEIHKLYPYEKDNLAHMEKRLLENIMLNLEILKEHEMHSSLTPQECEHHFDYRFSIDENYNINLHGIIDRIDINQDFLRVIDYKSSHKQLKEELVFSALQLQLITYLIIAQKLYGKRPLGAFYYSFATPNITTSFGKIKKRPLELVQYDQADRKNDFLKAGRLNGWITDENIEAMDDDGSHIVGVRNSVASGINSSTIYDFDTLESYLNELYKIIGTHILKGDIRCESATDACTYCPYGNVCAKANHSYPKDELIEINASLYKKGGRKDA